MKKILLVLCTVFVLSLTACSNNDNSSHNESASQTIETDSSVQSAGNPETANSDVNNTDNAPVTKSVYVTKSFHVIEGAVIYDQTYDEYGYPDYCYFHKKCEACGDVSNNNGSTNDNLTTGYYCPKCKTSNNVEIKADKEWIEVIE